MAARFFDVRAHFDACRRSADAVRTLHALGPDLYAIEAGGEVSLADRATMISYLTRLSQGEPNDPAVGGGDVERA